MKKLPILQSSDLVEQKESPVNKELSNIHQAEELLYELYTLSEEKLAFTDLIVDKIKGSKDPELIAEFNNNSYSEVIHNYLKEGKSKELLVKLLRAHCSQLGIPKTKQTDTDQARLIGMLQKDTITLRLLKRALEKSKDIETELSQMTGHSVTSPKGQLYEVIKGHTNSKVRSIISSLNNIENVIHISKELKNPDLIRTKSEIAALYGFTDDEMQEDGDSGLNAWLEFNSIPQETSLEDSETISQSTTAQNADSPAVNKSKSLIGRQTKQFQNFSSSADTYEKMGNLVKTDTLVAYVNYKRNLTTLIRQLKGGKIVETKYMTDLIEKAMPVLTKNPPGIVYFHGDFGSGKTSLAVYLSRDRLKKEPIIINGSKFLEPKDFTQEFRIQGRPFNEIVENGLKELLGPDSDRIDDIKKDLNSAQNKSDIISLLIGEKEVIINDIITSRSNNRINAKSPDLTDEQQKNERDEVTKMVDDTFNNPIQGIYVVGALFYCMREGLPLIIDEANAVTPEVLISFNDLMTKKIGDKIQTKAGEIKIKPGFCVMWTGNTGARYKAARSNDIDPAIFSRITPIEVHYLPQSKVINNLNQLESRLELDKINSVYPDGVLSHVEGVKLEDLNSAAQNDQIFQVLVATLLNRHKGAYLMTKTKDQFSIFKDIYRLAMSARQIMDIFEGVPDSIPSPGGLTALLGTDSDVSIREKLIKANLTMRGLLDKIMSLYQGGGQALDIEYYIFKFIEELSLYPEEMAILYHIFRVNNFFIEEEWPQLESFRNIKDFKRVFSSFNPIGEVPKYKKIQSNGHMSTAIDTSDYQMRYFNSLETMQMIYGLLPPLKIEDYQPIIDTIKQPDINENNEQEKEAILGSIQAIAYSIDTHLFKHKYPVLTGNIYNQIFDEMSQFQEQINQIINIETLHSLSLDEILNKANQYADFIMQYFAPLKEVQQKILHQENTKTDINSTQVKLNATLEFIKSIK